MASITVTINDGTTEYSKAATLDLATLARLEDWVNGSTEGGASFTRAESADEFARKIHRWIKAEVRRHEKGESLKAAQQSLEKFILSE